MIQELIPRYCVWEFTRACNLRCLTCGSSAGSVRSNELTTQEARGLIRQLVDLGCEHLTFSGGEPFLRDDWFYVFQYASQIIGMEVSVVTNGTILNKKISKLLNQIKPEIVAVSLDGLSAQHNFLRGQDSFERAVAGIALLREVNIPVNIITQVNKVTLPSLEKLSDFIFSLDINSWMLQLTTPMGRAKKTKIALLPAQVTKIVDFIIKQRERGLPVYGADDIGYYCEGLHEESFIWQGCQAGLSVIGIEADGGVRGCLSMQALPIEGNIRRNSLRDIWHSPTFAQYNRDDRRLSGFCAKCDKSLICRGGCLGTAAAFGKLSEYPYCVQKFQSHST